MRFLWKWSFSLLLVVYLVYDGKEVREFEDKHQALFYWQELITRTGNKDIFIMRVSDKDKDRLIKSLLRGR